MIIFCLTLLSRSLCDGGENLDSAKIFAKNHREAGYLSEKIVFKMKNGGTDKQSQKSKIEIKILRLIFLSL